MPAAGNVATNDQNITYYPLRLEVDMNPKHVEKDKGTSVRLKYGSGFGITREDISGEDGIQRRELLEQFDVIVQWNTSNYWPPPARRAETPTTDLGIASIDRYTTLDFDRRKILKQFEGISQREYNWDGYESKKPNELSFNHAKHLMEEFLHTVVTEGHSWITPLISSDEDGNISVEWYGEERQLHFQIEGKTVVYIQVWGLNIETEMHVDTLHGKDYLRVWNWLLYG